MLILTRNVGDSIQIADNIKVTVLNNNSQVKLGIEAPKDVTVHRSEIYDKIQKETACA